MVWAYVSAQQEGVEGERPSLAAQPFCVWVQTNVRHLSWQQDATALRRNFPFLPAGPLWCGSGMALTPVIDEGHHEVSVERANKQEEEEGINSCLNNIPYF